MAQNEGSESSIEFFFTLDAAPELQNKHTIFAKVSGETVYNLLKLNESQTDSNDRPLYPHKINKVKILHNPFDDLVPSIEPSKSSKEDKAEARKKKQEGVKNFKLISFGDEAEQDEQEVESFPKETVKEPKLPEPSISSSSSSKAKITKNEKSESHETKSSPKKTVQQDDDSDSDYETTLEKEKLLELERKRKEIQDQIKDVKKQYQKDRKEKNQEKETAVVVPKEKHEDVVVRNYLDEKEKYKQKKLNVKGKSREDFTLALLAKFKNKLHSALDGQAPPPEDTEDTGEILEDENWLAHKLDFSESDAAVLAKDASKKEDDWYDIYDPRNPLNKRKRGAEKPSGELTKSKKIN